MAGYSVSLFTDWQRGVAQEAVGEAAGKIRDGAAAPPAMFYGATAGGEETASDSGSSGGCDPTSSR